MRNLRIGSLFSGYGGLEIGVKAAIGGKVAWHSEIEPGPCKVLSHHWPDVPNVGDVTVVDWTKVEPVDVITGGSPCQDLSLAGRRAGMRAGTRSGLWASMCDAIDIIRPRLVVWENVQGALSAGADSDLERCQGCLGDHQGEPDLRALGRLLGDLAELRYDAWWCGLRAADVGAPHGRFRVFVFAAPQDANRSSRHEWWVAAPRRSQGGRAWADACRRGGAPSPDADRDAVRLEPVGLARGDREAEPRRGGADTWGPYAAAVARWERVLGRSAPRPVEPGRGAGERLSQRFVEWLMGLPDGHVTDPAIGLTRNEQLKALGNGVVPQQAEAATRWWLATSQGVDA